MKNFLRDKVYCEEVEECPSNPDIAAFEVGCNENGSCVYFVSRRSENISDLVDWLADMVCADCLHMCPAAQKSFNCGYYGQDFTAVANVIANLNAGLGDLSTEDTPF